LQDYDFSFDHLLGPLHENVNTLLPRLPNAMVTLLAGFVVIRLLSWVVQGLLGVWRLPKGLREIIISLMDALLTIFLIIVFLQSLGLSNVAFIFSASVAALGLAIGNGSVTLVTDILAGIYLARDRDFSVGDLVQAGEDQTEGEIMSMDMRRTRIRDKDGRIHSMPNSIIERKEYVLITKKKDRQA
jgi:small-conductance mechanosensitive channel